MNMGDDEYLRVVESGHNRQLLPRDIIALGAFLAAILWALLCPAAEPVRIYAVQVHWLNSPTLTAQAPVVDKWTFAGQFKMRHLREELAAHQTDDLAWNVKAQIKGVLAKLVLFETDLLDEIENGNLESITDLHSFGCTVNYRTPVLTVDVPVKVGKVPGTVRIVVERGVDGILVDVKP